MKRIAGYLAISSMALFGATAHAANTAGHAFDAQVTLTAKCRVATGTGTILDFGTYQAFQTMAAAATALNITFECTRGATAIPSVAFDTGTNASNATSAPDPITGLVSVTGAGVVAGLQYTLSVTPPTAAVVGTAASTTSIGTPTKFTFQVNGDMPAGQAGDSTAATTQARTLTITY